MGSTVPVGTSNILESSLPFDLALFRSLHHIEVNFSLSPVRFLVNQNSCTIHHTPITVKLLLSVQRFLVHKSGLSLPVSGLIGIIYSIHTRTHTPNVLPQLLIILVQFNSVLFI